MTGSRAAAPLRVMSRPFTVAILAAAVGLIALFAAVQSSRGAEITGFAPTMAADDQPFTRSRMIEVTVSKTDNDPGGIVVERRLANSLTVNGGVLVSGTAVNEETIWTLADGPDGVRTVYGQLKYSSGAWSPIASMQIELDQSPQTALYFDIDESQDFQLTSESSDWHHRSSAAERPIQARTHPSGDAKQSLSIWDGEFGFSFEDADGGLAPGTYATSVPTGACQSHCATVSTRWDSCQGAGTVEIGAVTLTGEGDLATLDADFRLACGTMMLAGSLRYGDDSPITALDQSMNHLVFGEVEIGDTVDQAFTITNIGDGTTQFGEADISGTTSGDYEIVEDDCSREALLIGDSCAVTIRYAPTTFGDRQAAFALPDGTARGSRLVRLFAVGIQPTTLAISVDPPTLSPGQATVTVIVTPGTVDPSRVAVTRDGGGPFEGGWDRTVEVLSGPSRLRITTTMTLTPGQHTVATTFDGHAFHAAAAPASTVLDVPNTGRPWGFVTIDDGKAFTKSRTVPLGSHRFWDDVSVDKLAVSNDGVSWTEFVHADLSGHQWTLSSGNGTKTVYLRWHEGGTGRWSPAATDTITLDASVPTVTAPRRGFVPGTTVLTSSTLDVRMPWSGSDAGSGIARYELAQQTDGGTWKTVATTLTTPTATRSLATGHTYRFRVRGVDKAGNVSGWATGATFSLSRYNESSSRITYRGTWSTSSSPVFLTGSAKWSKSAGATARFTFTGRSIAWVARKGPDRGKAEVWVNGTKVATVDLYAASSQDRKAVWVGSWTTATSRTITIKVLGTAGRPRVDVDAIITAS